MSEWLLVSDIKPEEKQAVWYFFERCGVYKGFYGHSEFGDTFYGEHGFLTNDVTHWMPVQWSKEKPNPPGVK